jgi:hypothetical protein
VVGGAGEVVGEQQGIGTVMEEVATGRFRVRGGPTTVGCPVADEVDGGRWLQGGLRLGGLRRMVARCRGGRDERLEGSAEGCLMTRWSVGRASQAREGELSWCPRPRCSSSGAQLGGSSVVAPDTEQCGEVERGALGRGVRIEATGCFLRVTW